MRKARRRERERSEIREESEKEKEREKEREASALDGSQREKTKRKPKMWWIQSGKMGVASRLGSYIILEIIPNIGCMAPEWMCV